MKSIAYSLPLLLAVASARPFEKREVPLEHSHEKFVRTVSTLLQANNPDNIQDAVFGLLGNAAGSAGQGKITDTDCLQQATADQAFTNAKAANDVDGMTAALIYRTLERNTGSVGLKSVACTAIKAKNPEIAALQQHQDPASDGAQALNKQIVLDLARQIASVGGDPQQALQSGTFAPGQIGDKTGAGNTCDDANDAEGCIFTQNKLVEDATAAEIDAAVAGAGGAGAGGGAGAANAGNATASSGSASAGNATAGNAGNAGAVDCGSGADASAQAGSQASNNQQGNNNKGGKASSNNGQAAQNGQAASNNGTASGASGAASGASASGAIDLGNCQNAAIKFGKPSDGRNEDAFEPADLATFNHGSALNIGVISGFIVTRLQDNKCGANTAAIDAAKAGDAASKGLKGQAAADAFNQALGL